MATLEVTDSNMDRALVFAAKLARAGVTVTSGAALRYTHGTTVLGERAAIALALAGDSLAGKTPFERAQVTSWLTWADANTAPTPAAVGELEARLAAASYVAGSSFSIADAIVYYTLAPALRDLSASLATTYPAVTRWVRQLLQEPGYAVATAEGAPTPAVTVPPVAPLALFAKPAAATAAAAAPAPAGAAGGAAASSAAPPAATGEKKADKKAAAAADAAATAAATGGAGAPAAPAAAGGKGAKPAPAAAEPEPDPIAVVDLRVGVIVKVWEHPTAERLFCEEIDLGEPTGPRKIASGLRGKYTLEQMTGRKVVVVCNLKPRTMQGFESNGMVLAASVPEGKVELLDPPAGAAIGERVVVEGIAMATPYEPSKMAKKKTFDVAAEGLKVGDDLVAGYKGAALKVAAGKVTVPSLAGCAIH